MAEVKLDSEARYGYLLLRVAGLGGLLYGIDVGIISGALLCLRGYIALNPDQLSSIVAPVQLGWLVIAGAVIGVVSTSAAYVLRTSNNPIKSEAATYGRSSPHGGLRNRTIEP